MRWKAVRQYSGDFEILDDDDDNQIPIGQVFGFEEVGLKRARLIAAAPELLAELRAMVDELTDAKERLSDVYVNQFQYDNSIARAKAAIAKATGGA
jgi:hypothetical protein